MKICRYSFLGNFVLIVPLWNWNNKSEAGGVDTPGFNRTFMELKSQKVSGIIGGRKVF